MNKMTHYHTNATLILPDGTGICIDGMIVDNVDLSQDNLSVAFKFQQDSRNFDKISDIADMYGYDYQGLCSISIDGIRFLIYDVFVNKKEMVATFKISKI